MIKVNIKYLAKIFSLGLISILAILLILAKLYFWKIKDELVNQIKDSVGADKVKIGTIGFNFYELYLRDNFLEADGYKIKINKISAQFSIWQLLFPQEFDRRLHGVKVDGVDLLFSEGKQQKTDSLTVNDHTKSYRQLISSLSQLSFLNQITISDLNLTYQTSDKKIKLLTKSGGLFRYFTNNQIGLNLSGMLLSSEYENILVAGKINTVTQLAHFETTLLPSPLPQILELDKSDFRIENGSFAGAYQFDFNPNLVKPFASTGKVMFRNGTFLWQDKIELTNLDGEVTLSNNDCEVKFLKGFLWDSNFLVSGKIDNIFAPKLNLKASIKQIKQNSWQKIASLLALKQEINKLNISDNHSLDLLIGTDSLHYINFDYRGEEIAYKNSFYLRQIRCSGTINQNHLAIKNFTANSPHNKLNFQGKYLFNGDKNSSLISNFTVEGELFNEFKDFFQLPNSYQTKLLGSLSYEHKKWKLSSSLEIDDQNQRVVSGSCKFLDDKLLLDLTNVSTMEKLIVNYDFKNQFYHLESANLIPFLERVVDLPPEVKGSAEASVEVQGNLKRLHFKLDGQNGSSWWSGNSVGIIHLDGDTVNAAISYSPVKESKIPIPLRAALRYHDKSLIFNNLIVADKKIRGQLSYNFANSLIDGSLQADSLDLGRLAVVNEIATNTGIRLKLSGQGDDVKGVIWIKEGDFSWHTMSSDSLRLNGELELHFDKNRLRLEKLIIGNDNQKLLNSYGYLDKGGELAISGYGNFELLALKGISFADKTKGQVNYNFAVNGTAREWKLSHLEAKIKGLNLYSDYNLDDVNLLLKDNGSGKISIEECKLSWEDLLDLKLTGLLPYNLNDELEVEGRFRTNLFKIAGRYVDFLKGSSSNEGAFTLNGKLNKPELKNLELYFLDGNISIDGVFAGLNRFRGKVEIGSDKKLKLLGLGAVDEKNGNKILFRNYFGLPEFEDFKLLEQVNCGTLGLYMPNGGITGRAPYMMKRKDYGLFTLLGHHGTDFLVGQKDGILALRGKAHINNLAFTYPFLDEKVFREWQPVEGDTTENDYPGLLLDLEVIPAGGVTYFYDGGTDERNVWEKIVSSFDWQKNSNINNVWINLAHNSFLRINGNPLVAGEPVLSGDIYARNGKFSYAAWSFDLNEATVRFDDIRDKVGDIDPYLSGSGKTKIRSRVDSTGYSGYEELMVKVVGKENGIITDSEGARFSNYFVEILDSEGNRWLDKMEKNVKNIDTKATSIDLFNSSIDQRVLHPLLMPLERALSKFLGLQFSINPRIAPNLNNEYYFSEDNKNRFGNLFLGSEVFITYPKDDFSISFNSRYIGTDIYAKEIEQKFGYQHFVSIDYYLGNYIFSSAGYSYSTLDQKYGYNLGINYRYRFSTLLPQYEKTKRWWRGVWE